MVVILFVEKARESQTFHSQNKISGSHNQLVASLPMVIAPIFWVMNDQLIKNAETAAARKISKARDRFPRRNCPRPGKSKEDMIAKVGLIGEGRVFPEIVMVGMKEKNR